MIEFIHRKPMHDTPEGSGCRHRKKYGDTPEGVAAAIAIRLFEKRDAEQIAQQIMSTTDNSPMGDTPTELLLYVNAHQQM
jgi:hypothetical protein